MAIEFEYKKLRGRIIEKFGTYKNFYGHLQITEEMGYRKLNGKAGFSQKDIIEWCELLDIKLKDVGLYFYA